MSIQITPANPSDLHAVQTLLTEAQLPVEGVRQHFADFFVACQDEEIVGCVGLEKYGDCALLRSLAVAPNWRNQKLGLHLTQQVLSYAQANTVKEVVLLTTTAADFFTRHFGFLPTSRLLFEDKLKNSPEWTLTSCASASCLVLPFA